MNRRIVTAIVTLALLAITGLPAQAVSLDSELSSLPQITNYLRAIGVDPGAVVVQQGQLNYAGPNCPGAEWNCTTSNRVVQLSPVANVATCLPAINVTLVGVDECVIVQSSASNLLETASTVNDASCDFDATTAPAKQKCKIKQWSKKGSNRADIKMRTTQRGVSPQFASQEAEISQMSESGNNSAKITQTIQQWLDAHQSGAVTQDQNARQYAKVEQTSTSGNNSSDVQQSQGQDEDATSDASIMQSQNTDATVGRNTEAQVTQISSLNGNNTSNLNQHIDQDQRANSPAGPVTQIEGNFSGGLQGTVAQNTLAPGVNRSTGTQNESQTQNATTGGTLTQTKVGPEFCCSEQIGGTTANVNLVTQSSVQNDNEGPLATQESQQSGQCSQTVVGATCTVDQTYTENGATDHETNTGMDVSNNRFCGSEGCFVD